MNDREFLVETSIQELLKYIISENNISIINAMRSFYASDIFRKLNNYDTGLYLESPGYIYELYKNEQYNGYLVQDEI